MEFKDSQGRERYLMNAPVVFYAWQNDRPKETTREFIRQAAYDAVQGVGSTMRVEESPRLDHDTQNEPGTPPISETILHKIKHSAMLIADMTFCSEIRDGEKILKKNPNPNVMMELGYGAAIIGWRRIILVMNKHYGSPESLPFDLKNHRFPITYQLGPNSEKGPEKMPGLVSDLEMAIRSCLMAEYDLVDATLARLSSYSRSLMKQCGPSQVFWESEADNKVLSRMDLAIAQMLELNVLRCVDAANEAGVGYTWTYLGQKCCHRLGIFDKPAVQLPLYNPGQIILAPCYLEGSQPNLEQDTANELPVLAQEEKKPEG
jgi:hypothetical protein